MAEDRSPTRNGDAFDCPLCSTYAHHRWGGIYAQKLDGAGWTQLEDYAASRCSRCKGVAMWRENAMVYPMRRSGPPPHQDMPPDVLAVYEEARDVSGISKKSAAALLRLALQLLVDDLEPGAAPINTKIGELVKRGLDPQVQQAMDVVRVVGNNAVHPGQIDLDADDELLPALFTLTNMIVEQVITRPKAVAGLFGSLPPSAQAAVAKRDGTTSPPPP